MSDRLPSFALTASSTTSTSMSSRHDTWSNSQENRSPNA